MWLSWFYFVPKINTRYDTFWNLGFRFLKKGIKFITIAQNICLDILKCCVNFTQFNLYFKLKHTVKKTVPLRDRILSTHPAWSWWSKFFRKIFNFFLAGGGGVTPQNVRVYPLLLSPPQLGPWVRDLKINILFRSYLKSIRNAALVAMVPLRLYCFFQCIYINLSGPSRFIPNYKVSILARSLNLETHTFLFTEQWMYHLLALEDKNILHSLGF